ACEFHALLADGQSCEAGARLAGIQGLASSMVTAEPPALNFLQRFSGVATLTRRFADQAAGRVVVLDTRKTTPTLRALEQYAVRAGGGAHHRGSLDVGVTVKRNHLGLAGSVAEAVRRMAAANPDMPIEVEVHSLTEADAAVSGGQSEIL